ncbi:MAG: glycosyltransferase [Kiritimatiellales bacterium]
MSSPLVSVLIPTYEYARFLPEAIESVLAQDFKDFELIIADDASQDNTAEICRKYAGQDVRVVFVQHPENLGLVENLNWCLRKARGKYIKYLLADDRLNHPSALRKMVGVLEQHPAVALVSSSRLIINEASCPVRLKNELGRKDRMFDKEQMLRRCFSIEGHNNLIGEPSAVLFRREQASRGFDPDYRQLVDLEMWFYLLQNGALYYISDPLCCFRKHSRQQTEVNRRQGVYLLESVALFATHGGDDKSVLFRQLHIINKKKGAQDLPFITQLKQRFTPAEYAAEYLQYRLMRPFFNARRSVRTRIRAAGICLDALLWKII